MKGYRAFGFFLGIVGIATRNLALAAIGLILVVVSGCSPANKYVLSCKIGDTEVFRSPPAQRMHLDDGQWYWFDYVGEATYYTQPQNSMCSRIEVKL